MKLQINYQQKLYRQIQPKALKASQENEDLRKDLETLQAQCLSIEEELAELNFDPDAYHQMQQQEAFFETKIRDLTQKVDEIKRKSANIDFAYTSPSPSFDRSSVKGLVAQLFTLDKDKHAYASALEICAGGRLYNVRFFLCCSS